MASTLHLDVIMLMLAFSLLSSATPAAGRPHEELAVATAWSDRLIQAVCAPNTGLICHAGNLPASSESAIPKGDASLRDASIVTINDMQRDFFLESSLKEGAVMSLDSNLRDSTPWSAFLPEAAAHSLAALKPSNADQILDYFGVHRNSHMATSVATAAYLCGSAALPGEARGCAASGSALAAFVASELGHSVKVYSTSNAPTSTPAVKSSVKVTAVTKGSVAEGKTIVVCHHVAFPSMLYYCHRVTGTKVVEATLKPARDGAGSPIKAVGICHINTNTGLWLSRHPAFAALKIARGEEACHWLVENDLVFTPATSQIVE